ncbi:MAG: hypothetical protein PHV82_15505, partial [Victivallaceae bacterium]|nr:hypothetical protein [Victivallaceae bacterium]
MALQSMMNGPLKTLQNFMPAAFYVFSFLGGSVVAAEDSFWSVNADNTDFGIASNTGVLRYYRHNRQTPLIEYMSLGEDKAFQVEYKSVKWSYSWKDGSLSLKKGNGLRKSPEEKTARIMPLYFLTPEAGVVEFESQGKLFSDWTENFRFARQKNGSSLEISCSRAKADRNASFVFKFMRWIDEEGVCFFAGSADGKLTRLRPGHKITGREVIIPFTRQGCVLRISTDTEAKISLSDILTFVGGRTLAFEFGEAKNFKITVDDTENVKTCKLDNLILNVDNSNGTSCIEAGGMPLLFLDGFEGETRQSAGIGKKAQWQISETGSHDRKLIKLSGRVKSRWNGVISAANDSIDYSFSSSGPGGIGTVMEFPSGRVGCPLEILLPNGKTVKSHKNIPLRIGADIELGQLPSGTQLAIRLTNTEQLLIKAGAAFSLRSFQSSLSPYSSAFDSSDEEDLAKIKSKRVVHTFPSGGLIFSGRPGEKISLNLTYRQSCRTCPAVKISDPVYSGKINISEVPDGISVESPWWRIIHSNAAGGGMAAIVFRNVSGKNILSAPEKIHVLSDGKEFSNIHDRKATFLQDGKKLTVNGMLTSADGGACGISYTLHYEYHDGYIKRKTVLHAEKPVKTERIGILKLDFTPELDHCGYKPFVAAFRKAVFPGPPIVESSNFGCGFLSVYRTGGEGVDFVPGSNVLQWATQLSNDNNARRWSIAGNAAGGPSIIIEPYCKPGKPVNFQGSASFDYYIGLPKLNSTFVHNYFPANFPVWFYKEKNWPSAEAIRKLAEYGVTLSLDGNYESNWVGQQVPENASASKQAKLKAIADRIAEWHRQIGRAH